MSQISINSASDAEKAWINYYYHGNTMQITDVQMGEIVGRYSSFIPTWRNYAESQDTNEYELSDETFEDSVDRGYEYGQDLTDYDNTGWDKTKQIGRTVVDGSTAAVSGGHALIKGGEAAGNVVSKATGKGATEAGKQATKSASKAIDWALIGFCAWDLAQAGIYKADKPNEEQVEAVNVLAEDMLNQQAITADAQDQLITMDSELSTAADEAIDVRDVANNDMSDSKTLYEFHADTIRYYDKAKTAGYEFTKEDVDTYQESLQYMTELSDGIGVTQEDAENAVNDIYDEMSDYQSGFDDAADSIAEVEGVTDYAEGFDELTQTNCTAESYIQYVNTGAAGVDAGLAAINVAKYASLGWAGILPALAFAAAGVAAGAAGVMDGVAAKEQSTWADEAGNEVGLREGTQEMNAVSLQTYNENVDYYDGYMQNVEDLDIVRPDDMEAPEAEVPTVGKQDRNDPKNPYNPKNNKKQEKP